MFQTLYCFSIYEKWNRQIVVAVFLVFIKTIGS